MAPNFSLQRNIYLVRCPRQNIRINTRETQHEKRVWYQKYHFLPLKINDAQYSIHINCSMYNVYYTFFIHEFDIIFFFRFQILIELGNAISVRERFKRGIISYFHNCRRVNTLPFYPFFHYPVLLSVVAGLGVPAQPLVYTCLCNAWFKGTDVRAVLYCILLFI